MTNILSTEFYRLKKSKMFWALFGVSTGLPILSMLLFIAFPPIINSFGGEMEVDGWDLIRSLNIPSLMLNEYASLLHISGLFAVICTSIFLSRDFSYGTFRNVLLANYSRLQLYLSHLVIALVVGASFLGGSMLTTLVFNGSVFGFYQMNALQVFTAIATAFALGLVSVAFAQTLMCMFLFATRKLSVTLACTIVITTFLPEIMGIIVELYGILGLVLTDNVSLDYTWIPFFNAQLLNVADIDGALVGKILLYNVPVTVFFGFMGWVGFRKKDLK